MANKTNAGRTRPGKPSQAVESGSRRRRSVPLVVDEPWGATAQRWVIVAVAVGVIIAVTPQTGDPVNVIKMTLLLLGAVALLALGTIRAVSGRAVAVPSGLAAWASAAFAVALLVAFVRASDHGLALWGDYGRNIGLLLYLGCLVVFLTLVRVATVGYLRTLAVALAAAGGLVGLYAVFQRAGVDAISWQNDYQHSIGTLGNPDFAGACLAILLPFAAWATLFRETTMRWRAAAGGVTVLIIGGIVAAHALQGVLAGAAGLSMMLLAWLCSRGGRVRSTGALAWIVAAAVAAAVAAMGIVGSGPAAALSRQSTIEIRHHYWHAAWAMFTHNPVAGLGLGMFGSYYRGYRSAEAVQALGTSSFVDAPHSVPLSMLATGGVILALAYLAFVVAVAVAVVRALRNDDPARVLLAGTFAGAWLAYHAQAAISIDMVPLATLHFVVAGAIVFLGEPNPLRVIPLGGAQPARRTAQATPTGAVITVTAIVAVVVAWFATKPLRADVAMRNAQNAAAAERYKDAWSSIRYATSTAPWVGQYWLNRALYAGSAGDLQDGFSSLRRAYRENPRNSDVVVSLARASTVVKNKADAVRYYRRAIELDPHNPDLVAALKKVESGG